MRLDMAPKPSDIIIGFGCYNVDIAQRTAELYHAGFAPKVLFTGGLGRNTSQLWSPADTEAERFAAVAIAEGVPEADILIENKATNTAENIQFARQMLREAGLPANRLLGVHKPFMERRIHAAMGIYWPEPEFLVTSPRVTLEEYIALSQSQGMEEKRVIEVLVGDFQRIDAYARRGWQVPQQIPERAWEAFRKLVRMGYDRELVK